MIYRWRIFQTEKNVFVLEDDKWKRKYKCCKSFTYNIAFINMPVNFIEYTGILKSKFEIIE